MRIILPSAGRIPTDNNWKQADVIEGCEILYNKNGTAPGIFVSEGEKTVILLPGPPLELKSMFTDSVMPKLQQKCGQVFYSQTVKIVGPWRKQCGNTDSRHAEHSGKSHHSALCQDRRGTLTCHGKSEG